MLRILSGINGRDIASKGMTRKIELSQVAHGDSPFFEYIGEELIRLDIICWIVGWSATGTHAYDINANCVKPSHKMTK